MEIMKPNKTHSNTKLVHSMRDFIPMRFRLTHEKAIKLKNQNKQHRVKMTRAQSPQKKQEVNKNESQNFTLKYILKLSEQHLLIGNQYQLNFISISCILEDFIDTTSQWVIAEDDPITLVLCAPKIHSIFIVCTKKLHIYSYSVDSMDEAPKKIHSLSFVESIKGVYLVKRSTMIVLLQTTFEAFELNSNLNKINFSDKKSYNYFQNQKEREMKIEYLIAPEQQGSIFQIFFRDITATNSYNIYAIKVECQSSLLISIQKMTKFCEIPQRYINYVQIYHYHLDIYLIHLNHEFYAVRNNYFLDNIISNASKLKSYIKQISKSQFFLYHKDRFDFYHYILDETTKPEKFRVNCYDTIPFSKPNGSVFVDIFKMDQKFTFIFQQNPAPSSQILFWIGLSQQISVASKIDKIFPKNPAELQKLSKKDISEKCQLALMIGLNKDEAYLQLWNRSNKNSKTDYDLLIATENYQMIAGQIENKFKKNTLKYLQVQAVISNSLKILRQKMKVTSCTMENVRQFSVCHFLLQKLIMFKHYKMSYDPEQKLSELTINIQDYTYLTEMEILKQLIQLLSQFLSPKQKNKKLKLHQIRALMTQFSLIFHLTYHEMIPKLIAMFKSNFFELIKATPQLLPLTTTDKDILELKGGPWACINLKQTQDYFILENVTNFDNKNSITEFENSKFYIVYKWYSHGAIKDSITIIKNNIKKHNPTFIFILLYENLYLQRKSIESNLIDQITAYIEQNYPLFPKNLRRRFRFYQALYDNFYNYYQKAQQKFISTFDFFSLSDDELFLIYFKKEREKRGIFILKQIQPIYVRTVDNGDKLFMDNMFNFFKNKNSAWSDLKIILNKFNNEKQDFHYTNYKIFEIIVKALMEKVNIGGISQAQQADLSEVLSYLQNIPFPLSQQKLLQLLINIQQIHQQQQMLKNIKINMNLRQILQRGEEVIFKMVQYEIQRNHIKKVHNINDLKIYTYKILADINHRKSNIYVDKHKNFPLKCFVIILMQDQQFISKCKVLLKDQFLKNEYGIDEKLIENIVYYLYRKRLYLNSIYEDNKQYIYQIINLLNKDNVKRRFLELSEVYANIFSRQQFKIKYPFFKTYYPTISEVAKVIHQLNKEELLNISYEQVFEIIIELKSLGEEVENLMETNMKFGTFQGDQKIPLMKHELYTVFFMEFINQGLIKEKALIIVKEIISIDTIYNKFNIIFPVFLIEIAQRQLINQLIQPFSRLISYYYNDQNDLLNFTQWIFTRKQGFTNIQLTQLFEKMKKTKEFVPIYNSQNNLFTDHFKKILQNGNSNEQIQKYNEALENIWLRMKKTREQFAKQKIYGILYRLMLHNPSILALYILRKKVGINVISFRAFLTLLSNECVFDMKKVLQFGQIVFSIIMERLQKNIKIQQLIFRYTAGQKYSGQLKYTNKYFLDQIVRKAEDLVGNSILAFRQKLKMCEQLDNQQLEQAKQRNLRELLQNPSDYLQLPLIYPFDDNDKGYAQQQYNLNILNRKPKAVVLEFNDITQRSEQIEHLNYFLKPTFKSEQNLSKCLSDFYANFTKKRVSNHVLHRVNTDAYLGGFKNLDDLNLKKPFETMKKIEQDQSISESNNSITFRGSKNQIRKSQSLHFVLQPFCEIQDQNQLEDLQLKKQNENSKIDICLSKENSKLQAIQEQIKLYLSGKEFNIEVLPLFKDQEQRYNFLAMKIQQVYQSRYYPLIRRVQIIWILKKAILGQGSVNQEIQKLTIRLGNSSLLHCLLTSIEDLFTTAMFIEEFTSKSLLQLVKENASEFVIHHQDTVKIGLIIEEVFQSEEAKEEVLMMFLVKLCRSYINSSNDKKAQNHIKDEFIILQQNIRTKAISNTIELYSRSKNEDLKGISKILQYFKDYHNNKSGTSNKSHF